MRASREDLSLPLERPKSYLPLVIAAAVVVLAIPLYFVLRDPAVEPAEAPAPMPVVRDSAIVAPPVVDAPAQQQAATTTTVTDDFRQRQLAPGVPTVGAGTAAVVNREGDSLVIDGPLLQEIEEDAGDGTAAQ